MFRAVLRDGDGPPLTQFHKRKMVRSDLLAQWIEQRTTPWVRPTIGGSLADALKSGSGQQQLAA